MIGAGEVLFILFFKEWLVQLVKTEDVLRNLCVRLSEAGVLADWSEFGQKAQKVKKEAQVEKGFAGEVSE